MVLTCVIYKCSKIANYRFPKDPKLKSQWVKKINRKNWQPSSASRVCGSHFSENAFLKEKDPGYCQGRRKLHKDAIPTIFTYLEKDKNKSNCHRNRMKLQEKIEAIRTIEGEEDITDPNSLCVAEQDDQVQCIANNLPLKVDASTQTEISYIRDGDAKFRASHFGQNDEMVHFYTGLQTFQLFYMLFNSLQLEKLTYKRKAVGVISKLDQFLMVMMRLRRYLPVAELAFLFDVSEAVVSNVTTSWTDFLYQEWSRFNLWPSRALVDHYMPTDFKKHFPSTRVILDTFEFPIQKPADPANQRATFSSYKNRNTGKVLLGITPGGLISYISPVYGGAASDRQLVERSDLVQLCERGDAIMADKGFNVQDIFAPFGVTVNTPTFLTNKNKLSSQTVKRDRKISSKRIHVERLIGLGKTFKILRNPLSRQDTFNASKIVYICFFVCNFRNCIVNKNA